MQWNEHYNLANKHAFLGASKHSWLNYDSDKLVKSYMNAMKKEEGTELHALASDAINHHVKLANLKKALNLFVNDAIGYGLASEQVLYYSDNCFGTADAIIFKDGLLRIHDLKTGLTPVEKFYQLDIYAALFCLEYDEDPRKIEIVERLYQGRGWTESVPDGDDILTIMNTIVSFDRVLEEAKANTL